MAKLKTAPKVVLVAAVTGAVLFGVYKSGILDKKPVAAVAEQPAVTAPATPAAPAPTAVQETPAPAPAAAAPVEAAPSNAGLDAVLKAGKK